ncbi:hypothetical protein ONZ45_g19114 [Pleurotus djamor]|nr:hypothetical protein ONZ45_g19114 [Pleurotus djamor]
MTTNNPLSLATTSVPPRVSSSPAPDSEGEYDFEGPLGLVVPPTPAKPQPPAERTSYAQAVKGKALSATMSKGSTLVQYDSSDAEMASPPTSSQDLPPTSATPSPTTTAIVPSTLPRPAVATGFHTSSSVLTSRSVTPPPRRQKVAQPDSPELTPSSAIRHQRKRTKTTNASQPQVESSQTTGPSVRARQPVTTPPPLSAPAFVAAPVPAAGLPTRRQKVPQPHSLEVTASSAIHHQRKRTKTTNVSQPQAESSQTTASSLRAVKAVIAPPRVSAPLFVAPPPPNSDPSNLFDDDDGVDFASRNHRHQRQSPIGRPIVSQPRLPNSPTSSRRSASPPTTSVTQHMEHGDSDDDPFQATQDTPASDIEDSDDAIPPRQHLPTAVTAQSNDRVVNMRLTSFRGRVQAPPRRTYSTKRGRK